MTSVGPFVDLGRVARSLDSYATQSSHALTGGQLGNVPRALEHERSVLKAVLADALEHPLTFTGAADTQAGGRLLKSSIEGLTGAIDAAQTAIHSPTRPKRIALATIPASADASVTQTIERAATSLRAAFEQLGGLRDLPVYRTGAPEAHVSSTVADPGSRAVIGRGHRPLQAVLRGVTRTVLAPALGIRSASGSTLPASGRTILAPNHVTPVDMVHVLSAIRRPVRPMAMAPLFTMPVVGSALRAAGAFPVRHGDADAAFATARAILARDEAMLIYPAGMLHHANGPGAHGVGAAALGAEMGAAVTPMGTWGSGPRSIRWTPSGERVPTPLRRPMTSVAFGEPIAPPATSGPFEIGVFRERIAREQEQLIDVARAHHTARVDAARARAPYVAAAGGAALLAGSAGLVASRD